MTVIVAALGWSWRETEVDPLTGEVSADRRDRGPNSSELAALEHALRLAELWDARVVAVTVGPAEADAMLRDALAVGAAQALRVEPASWTAGPRPVAAAARRIRVLGARPYRPRPRELPGPTGTALRRTLELTGALVQRTPPTVVGPLPPDQAASELLAYLRRHGYLATGDAE
jgi:hypothetical protein